jgi:hypothetical protein
MKTVDERVDTLEATLEPVGQLDIPMSHFLQAHPEMSKPIPELRLRQILTAAKTKEDLPRLWLIWRAYNHLSHNGSFGRELEVICWKIEEIVLQELDLPENDNLETLRELRSATPTNGEAGKRADEQLNKKFDALVDKSGSLDDLVESRKLVPAGYPQHQAINELIREKALGEIMRAKKPKAILGLLDRGDLGLNNQDKRDALNHTQALTEDISVLEEVVRRLSETADESRFHEQAINAKILRLCKTKEAIWHRVETVDLGWKDSREAVARILKDFGPPSIEDLERVMTWSIGDKQDHQYSVDYSCNDELIKLKVVCCRDMADNTKDPDVARKLYGWFKDINHENDRRFAIKVAAIRTLYKLSQVQLT